MVSVIPTRVLGPRFELLDYLRFAAAVAVLAYHWLYRGIETNSMSTLSYPPGAGVALYGYLGVQLFFIISGFVIAISAHGRSAADFAARRGVRLYPAFWAAMLTTAVVTALWGAPEFSVTPVEVLANLTMAPNVFDQPLVDGVYWTLLNELIFYAMVFLFLLFRAGWLLDAFFPAWAIGMVLVLHITPGLATVPLFGGLFSYFAAGAIISTIHRRGWNWWQAIGLAASFYVALRDTADTVAEHNANGGVHQESVLVSSAIICGFFLIALLQIHPKVAAWKLPRSRLLGALTYPVYLLHAHLAFIFFNHFATDDNRWLAYAIALLSVGALAYVLHVFVERRLRKFWTWLFDRGVGAPIRWAERRLAAAATMLANARRRRRTRSAGSDSRASV